MANSYHQIYLQTVFPVKFREAVLSEQWRGIVLGVIGNLINETGCKTIIVNGVEDHVHCFFGLKPTIAVSDLMKAVKAKSSKYINDHRLPVATSSGRMVMVPFHTVNHISTKCITTLPTRSNIIKSNPSEKNTSICSTNFMYPMMSVTSLMT